MSAYRVSVSVALVLGYVGLVAGRVDGAPLSATLPLGGVIVACFVALVFDVAGRMR